MNRRERDGPLRRVTKGVGSLIGLAAEAHAHHRSKEDRTTTATMSSPQMVVSSNLTSTKGAGPQRESEDFETRNLPLNEEEEEEDKIENDTLDSLLPPSYDEAIAITLGTPTSTGGPSETLPLPYPIFLPQRRPRVTSRGFMLAYAPILSTHKNTTQAQFVTFLQDFRSSTQVSPVLHAVNIAALAAGFAPSMIAMAVSMSVQVSIRYVMAMQVKGRTDSFLDQSNRDIFWPTGCHAMVSTFLPGRAGQQFVDVDASRFNGVGGSRSGSGTQALELPQSAPLVLVAEEEDRDGQEKSTWKESSKFVSGYFDKRAQASHPEVYANTLDAEAGDQKPQFASRYSDPNHAVNSGSPISLLTGGLVNPQGWKDSVDRGGLLSKFRDLKQSHDDRSLGGGLMKRVSSMTKSQNPKSQFSDEAIFNEASDLRPRAGGRRTGSGIGLGEGLGGLGQSVRKAKAMQQDVLYLIIAEIPDDVKDEMRDMRTV